MEKDIFMLGGILLGLSDKLKLPKELYEFLSMDDQGMEGLEFMLSDSKLSRRIPPEVRKEYEIIYALLSNKLYETIENCKEDLDEIEKDPKRVIQSLIQESFKSQ